ncbi:MAG TPA: VOC family protein [Longimicrobiales bacterium]|nr:VOC family protein [Longimicrobiales bacterium]
MTAVSSITPILVVDAIEPCLPFWTDRLGFETVATVPHGDALGFAMLRRGEVEIMYQSRASVDDDLGEAAPGQVGLGSELAGSTVTLFVTVESLDGVLEALDGADVVVPRRQTFYGMDEVFVRAPCGTLVGFAARLEGAAEGEGAGD